MGKKNLAWALLLLTPWLLSGCMLLPQEEAPRTAPLLSSYTQPAYKTETVIRETLIEKKSVSCRYVPVQSAGLHFSVGGEYIDEVFVQLGDSVKKGQVLAQLQLSDMRSRIDTAQENLEETRLRLAHLDQLEELALRRCELEQAGKGNSALMEAREKVILDYANRRQSLEDSRTLQTLTLQSLEKQLVSRQIIAPFDGTITYVRQYDEGTRSALGERVITLADATLSLFRAETPYWHYFRPGDQYEIAVGKAIYAATVADEESLGLDQQEKTEGKSAYVYFKLNEPNFELEDGDTGRIELVLNVRENVLTLSEKAVASIGEQMIVYYQKDDGTKGYKNVETGMTINKRIEITGGLQEGETVVVD